MGAVLTPTPTMGDFSVEVRSESFYLNAPQESLNVTRATCDDTDAPSRWQVPAEQAAALIAALDQVMEHPAFPTWTSEDEAAHQVVLDGDHVVIDGPGHFHMERWPAWENKPSVVLAGGELEYRYVRGLRAAIAELAGSS